MPPANKATPSDLRTSAASRDALSGKRSGNPVSDVTRAKAAHARSHLFERRRTLMQQWADYFAATG